MGNIVKADVSIVGTRPLIWNHFSAEALSGGRKEKSGVAGNDPEEWRNTVLITKKRQLYLPPENVFSMCREAARFTKRGRASIQTSVAATLQVLDEHILIDRYLPKDPVPTDHDALVYIYTVGVVNPSTGGRNLRHRIATKIGWKAKVRLEFDSTIVSRNELQAVMIDAGKLVGLGDGRQIGFGRFEVESFKASES